VPSVDPIRIPLHHLRLKQNIPAGMNPMRVMAIADALRNCGQEIWDPILVRSVGPDDWLVLDGRHRFVASYIAGMPDILAVEETS
jgi:ParB-like chromosome segregation protein Spo0J